MLGLKLNHVSKRGYRWHAFIHIRSCGQFYQSFFIHNQNWVEKTFYPNQKSNLVVTSKFCACHDSRTAVACAKIRGDLISGNLFTAKMTCKIANETGSCVRMYNESIYASSGLNELMCLGWKGSDEKIDHNGNFFIMHNVNWGCPLRVIISS